MNLSTVPARSASELRRRAAHLRDVAAQVESVIASTLLDDVRTIDLDVDRTDLCERLIERSLHQLHRAADDLRATALRLHARADELDGATGDAA